MKENRRMRRDNEGVLRLIRWGGIAVIMILLAGVTARAEGPASVPQVAAAFATLDREIAADIEARAIPGLAIAVVQGGKTIWRHDYGVADLARAEPVGPGTRFRLGSMSKLLTGLAMVQLRDAGKLDLDDRVTRFLPWFRLAGDAHPAITLRELLLHLSGLPREAPGASWTDRVMPNREQLIRDLPDLPAAIPAETTWKYSNLGYAILGLVIEAASGESYADYLTAHVLVPLGMAETLVEPGPDTKALATGYGARGPDGKREMRDFLAMGALTPAAGIVATTGDMARLAAWALDERDGPVLSARSRREMLRIQADFSDFSGGQGLGWETRRAGTALRIGHAGKAAGFAGRLAIEPATGLGVVVLTNADENGPGKWADRALDLAGPAIAAAAPAPAPVADPAWQAYLGSYGTDQRSAQILIANGRLAWQDGGTRIFLDPAGPDRFKWASGSLIGEPVIFERDAAGTVTRMIEGGYWDARR
jgi:CubicO group peptidase (beta-lactamase class C family)